MFADKITDYCHRGLQRCLQLDPQLPPKLAQLDGKVIAIEGGPIQKPLFMEIQNQEEQENSVTVRWHRHCDRAPDLTLKGTPLAFLRLLSADKTKPLRLMDYDVSVHGDADLAQQLQQILGTTIIDWEEHLAKYTGDVAAHRIGTGLKNVGRWLKRSYQRIEENSVEYLQEEARQLPTRVEVENFYEEIELLNERCDRLLSRWEQHQA